MIRTIRESIWHTLHRRISFMPWYEFVFYRCSLWWRTHTYWMYVKIQRRFVFEFSWINIKFITSNILQVLCQTLEWLIYLYFSNNILRTQTKYSEIWWAVESIYFKDELTASSTYANQLGVLFENISCLKLNYEYWMKSTICNVTEKGELQLMQMIKIHKNHETSRASNKFSSFSSTEQICWSKYIIWVVQLIEWIWAAIHSDSRGKIIKI